MTTTEIINNAKKAKPFIGASTTEQKNNFLISIAQSLKDHSKIIISENKKDIENAREYISDVMIDRLSLNEDRINAMSNAILELVELPDPIGEELDKIEHKNGMIINKLRVPMGVVAMIYESRPNVTADAAALCIKSGNACILRGGKEAINTNIAIVDAIQNALGNENKNFVQIITDTSRNSAQELMSARGFVDLLIPRGGAGLIKACVENAKVPCIETGTGICHVYIDKYADEKKAIDILLNAKTSRPSVCNAAEVCLVHKDIASSFLPKMQIALNKHNVELRACENSLIYLKPNCVKKAESVDFDTEFLDYILAVKIVDSIEEAVSHISLHSTGHSEAIISEDKKSQNYFVQNADSSAVYINASTRFTDGGEFGLGCEIGISTQKLGARGPMGLKEITSYKYCIIGDGQVR